MAMAITYFIAIVFSLNIHFHWHFPCRNLGVTLCKREEKMQLIDTISYLLIVFFLRVT